MIAPNNVVFTTEPQRSVVDAFVSRVAKKGPKGASKATVEINSGNQHNRSANRNWPMNSPPYGYGGLNADISVLPVRIIMSPTCSSRFLVGRNALSATARTTEPVFYHTSWHSCPGHRPAKPVQYV